MRTVGAGRTRGPRHPRPLLAIAAAGLVLAGCGTEVGTPPDGSPTPTTVTATPSASPTLVPFGTPWPSGRLFFTHTTSGDVQTALVADAGGQRALTAPGEVCCVLRKSPTREQLLVLPSTDFSPPLTGATLGTDGGDLTPLPRTDPTLNLVPSAWSPDGTRIAFEGWVDGEPSRTGIYTARVSDGADLVRVTNQPGRFHDVPLDYSPDGKRLVLYRSAHPDPDPYTDGSLWVVNVDGTEPHRITTGRAPPTVWARWSPDGSRIVFAAERLADRGPLWTVKPDGSDLVTVFEDSDGFVIAPDWSPDGTRIVFGLDPSNDEFTHPPNRIYLIDATGKNLELVDDSPYFKRQFDWVG